MSDPTPAPRQHLVTWEDPMIGAQAALSLSGLDYMQKMMAGDLPPPPIARLMNLAPVEVAQGRVVFACEPAEYHYNPIGVVHGGLAATLLDSAMGCCVHTTLPAGVGYTTLELNIKLLRPLTLKTGVVRCEAEMVHSGRTVAVAQARVVDATGRLYAHGTTTCMILRPE
ncbi:MAG: PaaI family thioesterase [Anaerolineae bacterium]|jgi:uncharacterized protein (TIGR00369 family)|nr:PaaI family thioesterase [Anaerolineae bacterium]